MSRVYMFLLIFVVLIHVASAETSQRTMDDNSDGKPDQWYTIEQGVLLEYQADRNFDGLVDYKAEFIGSDQRLYEEFDFNYDGDMDDFYYFEEGTLARQEIDTNFDMKVDMWVYFARRNVCQPDRTGFRFRWKGRSRNRL